MLIFFGTAWVTDCFPAVDRFAVPNKGEPGGRRVCSGTAYSEGVHGTIGGEEP